MHMQVWRIAFFGRLEERKGIKLFIEALNKLQAEASSVVSGEFEVYIVGPEAVIDMVRPLTLAKPYPQIQRWMVWSHDLLTWSVPPCRFRPSAGWQTRRPTGRSRRT